MSGACVGRIGWSESLELGTDPRRVVFVLVVPVFVVVSALAVRTHEAEPLTMSREPLIEPPRSYREGKSEGRPRPMFACACNCRRALEPAPRLGRSCRRSAR